MTNEIPDIRLATLLKHTEESDGCLEWTGHASFGKFPQWRVGGTIRPVRRVLWLVTRGPLKPSFLVSTKCQNPLCVHPDHLIARSKSASLKGVQLSEIRRRRIAATKRATSKLTIEQVREIRASEEPAKVLDQRFDLTPGYASRIRRGKAWEDHANPFAGLRRSA